MRIHPHPHNIGSTEITPPAYIPRMNYDIRGRLKTVQVLIEFIIEVIWLQRQLHQVKCSLFKYHNETMTVNRLNLWHQTKSGLMFY